MLVSHQTRQFPKETRSFFNWLEGNVHFWIRDFLHLSGHLVSSRYSLGARKTLFQLHHAAFSSQGPPHEGCAENTQPLPCMCTPGNSGPMRSGVGGHALLSLLPTAHSCDHDRLHNVLFDWLFLLPDFSPPSPPLFFLHSLPKINDPSQAPFQPFNAELG